MPREPLARPRRLAATIFALLALFAGGLAGQADAAPSVELTVDGLSAPARVTAPEGDPRLFVVELTGRIRVFDRDGTDRGVFLDWSDRISTGGERGLLGLAFDPDYAENGRFFINYTDPSGDTRITRLEVDPADPDRALPDSETAILLVDQPLSNHNGGQIDFGPDGMLYVGLGDGGGAGDTDDNAQNRQLLLGKMLRLDVSGDGPGYQVPPDNPFTGDPSTRDEIWALGLRNPWVYGFDRATGDLYIADVGQGEWEEVSIQPNGSAGGENYGWRIMEGPDCYNPPNCDPTGLTLPVFAYPHGFPDFHCS
ncbi:glucose dehydrogenase, partial [bacterium]|nr:glucose dehydrogenase [bacterium]